MSERCMGAFQVWLTFFPGHTQLRQQALSSLLGTQTRLYRACCCPVPCRGTLNHHCAACILHADQEAMLQTVHCHQAVLQCLAVCTSACEPARQRCYISLLFCTTASECWHSSSLLPQLWHLKDV